MTKNKNKKNQANSGNRKNKHQRAADSASVASTAEERLPLVVDRAPVEETQHLASSSIVESILLSPLPAQQPVQSLAVEALESATARAVSSFRKTSLLKQKWFITSLVYAAATASFSLDGFLVPFFEATQMDNPRALPKPRENPLPTLTQLVFIHTVVVILLLPYIGFKFIREIVSFRRDANRSLIAEARSSVLNADLWLYGSTSILYYTSLYYSLAMLQPLLVQLVLLSAPIWVFLLASRRGLPTSLLLFMTSLGGLLMILGATTIGQDLLYRFHLGDVNLSAFVDGKMSLTAVVLGTTFACTGALALALQMVLCRHMLSRPGDVCPLLRAKGSLVFLNSFFVVASMLIPSALTESWYQFFSVMTWSQLALLLLTAIFPICISMFMRMFAIHHVLEAGVSSIAATQPIELVSAFFLGALLLPNKLPNNVLLFIGMVMIMSGLFAFFAFYQVKYMQDSDKEIESPNARTSSQAVDGQEEVSAIYGFPDNDDNGNIQQAASVAQKYKNTRDMMC